MRTMYSDELRLPISDDVEDTLLNLVVDTKSKHLIKVQVPSHDGHDDMYSALSRAVDLCRAWTENNKAIIEHMLGEEYTKHITPKSIRRIDRPNGVGRVSSHKVVRSMVSSMTGAGGFKRRR